MPKFPWLGRQRLQIPQPTRNDLLTNTSLLAFFEELLPAVKIIFTSWSFWVTSDCAAPGNYWKWKYSLIYENVKLPELPIIEAKNRFCIFFAFSKFANSVQNIWSREYWIDRKGKRVGIWTSFPIFEAKSSLTQQKASQDFTFWGNQHFATLILSSYVLYLEVHISTKTVLNDTDNMGHLIFWQIVSLFPKRLFHKRFKACLPM